METAAKFAVVGAGLTFLFRLFEGIYMLHFALVHIGHEIDWFGEAFMFASTGLILLLLPSLFLLATAYLHIFRRSDFAFFASLIITIGMVVFNGYVLADGYVLTDGLMKSLIYVGMFLSPICYTAPAYIVFRNRFYA
ncbi:MAG TPA: hypothetical protein VJ781_07195 [Pyrinomonadaceae bacterium]|nr:hypothetical protein [Pyrinomonadaceae bacterium]